MVLKGSIPTTLVLIVAAADSFSNRCSNWLMLGCHGSQKNCHSIMFWNYILRCASEWWAMSESWYFTFSVHTSTLKQLNSVQGYLYFEMVTDIDCWRSSLCIISVAFVCWIWLVLDIKYSCEYKHNCQLSSYGFCGHIHFVAWWDNSVSQFAPRLFPNSRVFPLRQLLPYEFLWGKG